MTIQAVVNKVALRVVGTVPAAVFSSDDQVVVELRDLAQEVAEDIAASAEWRDLTQIATMTGGTSHPKPPGFTRMLRAQGLQDASSWLWGYHAFADVSEYIAATNGAMPLLDPGGWIILDGEFRFFPATAGTATFPYITDLIVRADDGTRKSAFTEDTDRFVLPERLLTLGLIWRYRAQKGLDYTEDMQSYEIALAQAQDRDKGARVLRPDRVIRAGPTRQPYINRGF